MSQWQPTVPSFLRRNEPLHRGRTLIVAGGHRRTYDELDDESALLARGLLAEGVSKGTRVGILAPNGIEWVLAWLAAARIGALVVPINTFYKTRELHHVLAHADVERLITVPSMLRHDYLARLEEAVPGLARASGDGPLHLPEMPYLRTVHVFGDESEEARPASRRWVAGTVGDLIETGRSGPCDQTLLRAVEEQVFPSDWLTIVYSSGSTAAPKGVVHSHGAVLRHSDALADLYDFGRDERIYSPMPFFWVGGFVLALLAPMREGACLLTEDHFEPGETLAMLEAERATMVMGWPHYAKEMSEHPTFDERDLTSIRRGSLHELLPEEERPKDLQLRTNSLGMTETCGPHTGADSRVELPERLRGAFGYAFPGVEHRVVDAETGETLPPTASGEICVRGYSLMQGLYKVERQDTFEVDGFYRTGDGGHFTEDGWLYFEGRLGEIIKTGGANVTPAEVEEAIVELPGVSQAYVAGIDDADRGQLVAAAVVPDPGAALDAEQLIDALKGGLASYKVPRVVWVCEKSELPFTDSGKLQRKQLSALLAARRD